MSAVSSKLYSILFADDSNLFMSGTDIDTMISTMNCELTNVVTWLNTNKLSLNVDKCNYMIFSQRLSSPNHVVSINGSSIDRVYYTKFLGVIIDHKLSWREHINFIKGKISKSIGILRRGRCLLKAETLQTLYYSFLYPYFSYCIEIWGFTYTTYLEPLNILQKKIVRIITSSSYREHTAPLFDKLKILNLSKLVSFRMCLFLFKYVNNDLPDCFSNMFVRNSEIHAYHTRQSNWFNVPRIRTDLSKHSFKYNAIRLYNASLCCCNYTFNYPRFKKQVKSCILKDYF